MNLLELKEHVDRALAMNAHAGSQKVGIVVRKDFSVGGLPTVPVRAAVSGFDWDEGKFLIYPEGHLQVRP